MQAVVTAPRAAQTHNLHRAGGRFGVAFVLVRLRALDTAGVLGRTSSLFRAALVAMSLQELAYQILAPPVQFPFEFALAHLPGFAGREEGFGIREDSIGRCARGSAREIDARDAGSRHVVGTLKGGGRIYQQTFMEGARQICECRVMRRRFVVPRRLRSGR